MNPMELADPWKSLKLSIFIRLEFLCFLYNFLNFTTLTFVRNHASIASSRTKLPDDLDDSNYSVNWLARDGQISLRLNGISPSESVPEDTCITTVIR